MMKRSEIDSNFFIFALIICSIANGGVLAQSQEAYAIIQTCKRRTKKFIRKVEKFLFIRLGGQREFVEPTYCITLPMPPINCNLPQACYTATGQPQDLKCQQLPDACLQKLQAAGIGTGGTTGKEKLLFRYCIEMG